MEDVLFPAGSSGGSQNVHSLHRLVHQSVTNSDMNVRRLLYSNIVLSGGNTLIPGLPERLGAELRKLMPNPNLPLQVFAAPNREYAPWLGAAVLSSLGSVVAELGISKEVYDESGPSVVHRYFPSL